MVSEPVLDFWVVLKLFSVFQCIFFSVLILTTRSENPNAQKFLVLFLIVFALLESDEILFYSRYIYQIPQITGLVDPLACSLGPLIYLYTSSLTNSSFSLRKHHSLFFLPVFALYLLWIPLYLKSADFKIEFLQKVFNEQGSMLNVAYPFNLFFVTISIAVIWAFIFLAMSIFKLYGFNSRLKQFYSSIGSFNLKWLKLLLILLSIIWLSSFLSIFITSRVLHLIDLIVFPIFIFLISYYDIKQKRIPTIEESKLVMKEQEGKDNFVSPDPKTFKEEPLKYAKSGINQQVIEALSSKLMMLINQDKVYIKNDLSLQELADMLGTSTHNLSQLLNENLNQNFYEFINYHRVQEAMRRLASEEYNNLKIMSIAFDSGFNSKSTFNTAFKKYSGLSPSDYRKSLKSS